MTMAEEQKKNEKKQLAVPGKSTIVKNILFLVFIVLAIVYCYDKYRAGNRYKAYNNAGDIYNSALELSGAGDASALAKFAEARSIYQKICDNSKNDKELNVDANYMLAQTYASMASCPQCSEKMAEGYMLLALETPGPCPLVDDPMRELIGGMTEEEKTALREFVQEEEKRLLQEAVEQAQVPSAEAAEAVPEG